MSTHTELNIWYEFQLILSLLDICASVRQIEQVNEAMTILTNHEFAGVCITF